MEHVWRWSAAALVTVVAFALATWICGALALPHVIHDPIIRWGLAGALGVAMAALAALWGHSFATGGQHGQTTPQSGPGSAPRKIKTGFGSTRNKIAGGTFYGPVSQGRDNFGPNPGGSDTSNPNPDGQ
jgi:hypothetical protein